MVYMFCFVSALLICVFFFFKQKTAYEMRISDWSSDVCSSDLLVPETRKPASVPEDGCGVRAAPGFRATGSRNPVPRLAHYVSVFQSHRQIGRASCRERVWQYG